MNASNSLNVGVVGVGHIGKSHARVYSELAAAGARLAAVYDADAENARAVAAQYGARAAGTLEEFAALVDAATVATPTPTHFPVAKFLLEQGKHLLVEKPITENTADARALSELARVRGCVLQVGHIERFNPALGALEAPCSPGRVSSRRTVCRPTRNAPRKSASCST